ncbi:hypothetical protein VTN49DRAFT_6559 [Thermomyces lanuginosus]|uniref:uncharacterized protein n=1 Tax=Thermomyces lanuginosus TaxID=5541 RepID=UPI0037440AB9
MPTHRGCRELPTRSGVTEWTNVFQVESNQAHVLIMTRSHKQNSRDYSAGADRQEPIPRYFAKSGPVDADPRKTKKDGAGRANWGRSGDEVQDYEYNFHNARRHSNSSSGGLADFKTKFETVEPEPVFEENIHGPIGDDAPNGVEATKVNSNDSSMSGRS